MEIQRPEKKWLIRQPIADISEQEVKTLSRAANIPETIIRILAIRGIINAAAVHEFLTPSLHRLPRPHNMKGMSNAVSLLMDGLKSQTPVTVYGDFDADGVTSTAVLSLFFKELGLPVTTYIPDRIVEGYGLNSMAIKKIHEDNLSRWNEPGILLTADCGISDVDMVAEAKKLGFRVIVTDHHKPPDMLPEADAILNPLQKDCAFPCKNLAGVGVAFYLILGLRSELVTNGHWPEEKIPNLKSYMDLVAIGTVADQVPVTGCNRIIIRAGLEVINQFGRPGIHQLLGRNNGNGPAVSVEDIAFRVAPRINAAGRIGSAHTAVSLMTSVSLQEAWQFAAVLEDANSTRKNIESGIFNDALQMLSDADLATANSVVLYKEDWHQGVLGIVASRLTDRLNLPAILLTDCPQQDKDQDVKLVKGSGRSVEGIDIHEAVSACHDLLQRFGGHTGAVGLTLQTDNIDRFTERFNEAIGSLFPKKKLEPSIYIDLSTSLQELTDPGFLAVYSSLAPFGTGNPEPVFSMTGQTLANLRMVGSNHLKFSIVENSTMMNGIGFNFGDMLQASKKSPVDLAFTLRLNTFMGQEKWQINLVDLKPSE